MAFECTELTATEEIEALAPEWAALWERSPAATPFQHPAWLLPWWRRLWGGGRSWWLAIRDGGRLAALLPLFIWGRETRCVSLAGSGITDYLDVLAEPENAARCVEAALRAIAARRDWWDLCDFQELRAGSALMSAEGALPGVRIEECAICPVLELPASWEALQSALPGKFRTDVRRARNRARNAGAAVESAGAENLDELLGALFRLHEARWRERSESGVLPPGPLQCFYSEAARELLAAGMLRLYGLRVEGQWAAVLYGFAGHGRSYAYLDGFDPALARLSPGTVLMSHAIEEAIGAGLCEFDFLRQGEPFKYLWGGRDRVNRRLLIAA